MAIVCTGGMADDVPRSTRSVICSGTSTGSACAWGIDSTGLDGEDEST